MARELIILKMVTFAVRPLLFVETEPCTASVFVHHNDTIMALHRVRGQICCTSLHQTDYSTDAL